MFENDDTMDDFSIASTAFTHTGAIPQLYTCEGDGKKAPPIIISSIPSAAKTIALIMEDPDVPKELMPDGLFVHWVLYNIPVVTGESIHLGEDGELLGVAGVNTRGDASYTGPCPPADHMPNEHRYFFYAYALDEELDLPDGASKDDVMRAMEGHVVAKAELMGTYRKTGPSM